MGRVISETARACVRLSALICSIVVLSITPPSEALAADICNAVALTDVPAWGGRDPDYADESHLKKGEIDGAVTQYRVNKKTGIAVFCSHGGYCYPRYLMVNGENVEVLRLTNCKIGAREPDDPGVEDPDVFYDVDVDRSRNSAKALRLDDVDNALLALGMCSACAGNAAEIYIKRPRSRCGSTVTSALAGDKRAIAELQSYPTYCDESSPDSASTPTPVSATPPAASTTNAPEPAASAPSVPSAPSEHINPIEVALAIAAVLYFIPSLIAFVRRKRNAPAIFALNLFLGWTFAGWVASIVWSLVSDPRE